MFNSENLRCSRTSIGFKKVSLMLIVDIVFESGNESNRELEDLSFEELPGTTNTDAEEE